MERKISVVDFFDFRSVQHLLALRYLERTGMWPEGFIPADVEFPVNWQLGIYAKIARLYIDDALEGLEN